MSLCPSLPERRGQKMMPRAAAIGELCILFLEGFPPPPLTSVLSLTQHMKPARTSPGLVCVCVCDLWVLLCYSERTHGRPCADPQRGLRGQRTEKPWACPPGAHGSVTH